MLILRSRIDPVSYSSAVSDILLWACDRGSRYVCIANVHVLMEAWDSPDFDHILRRADLVTPDGMPLVWMMRWKGQMDQQRVYGPTLMLHVLEAAAREHIPVGFFGGTTPVLTSLVDRMRARYDGLEVAFSMCPPFAEMTPEEDEEVTGRINSSGAKILFVGLGCPKQEIWMANHRGRVSAVMIGVGAAFDFHAGVKPQAPAWLQGLGLEWLFRLATEPRRLWKRYLIHNPRFVVLAAADLLGLLTRKE